VCLSVIVKLQQWGGLRPSGAVLPEKKKMYGFRINLSQFPCDVLSVFIIVVDTEHWEHLSPSWYSVFLFCLKTMSVSQFTV
jgi:hypothetical protein